MRTAAIPPEPTGDRDARDGADDASVVDLTSEAFARRLANLLTHRREESMLTLAAITRLSDGHFNRRQLRRFEAGTATLDPVTVSALASLYRIDVDEIVPDRSDISIGDDGVLATAGVRAAFVPSDPDSLLVTYLRLVRRLRSQERNESVSLRREDVEQIAEFLDESGERIVERLGALMGATRTQRRVMAGMFIAGAMIITVAVPSVAAVTGGPDTEVSNPAPELPTPVLTLVTGAETTDTDSPDIGGDVASDATSDVHDDATESAGDVHDDADSTGDDRPGPDAAEAANSASGAASANDGYAGAAGGSGGPGQNDDNEPADTTPAPDPGSGPSSPPPASAPAPPPEPAPTAPATPPTTSVIDDGAIVETGPPPLPPEEPPIVDPGPEPPPPVQPGPKNPANSQPPAEEPPEVAVGPPPVPPTTAPIVDVPAPPQP